MAKKQGGSAILKSIFNENYDGDVSDLVRASIYSPAALARGVNRPGSYITDKLDLRKSYLKLMCRGHEVMPAETIFDLCNLQDVTPDILHPADNKDPAPSEIVEAVVLYIEDLLPNTVPQSIMDFVTREVRKADSLAAQQPYSDLPNNFEMLQRVQGIVASYLPSAETYDFKYDRTDAPSAILLDLQDAVKYAGQGAWAPKPVPQWVVNEKQGTWKKFIRIMTDTAIAIAPAHQYQSWLHAFNDKVDALGFELAREMLLDDPSIFHPINPYIQGKFRVELPEIGTLTGKDVIQAFCESFNILKRITRWSDLEKRNRDNREGYLETASEIYDWSILRQTKLFLRAEANRRYLSGRLDFEDLYLPQTTYGRPHITTTMNAAPK
ncbi:MAG TPA: hypothetical protein VIN59_02845 [Alphaproteobacteria bacterium]